jgi:hypothetical protein
MNIAFKANRQIYVPVINKHEVQSVMIEVWQTPTEVTYRIHNSTDPLSEYFKWVESVSIVSKIPIYADSDIFGEEEPIGYEEVNDGLDHIEDTKDHVHELIKDGYEIESIVL